MKQVHHKSLSRLDLERRVSFRISTRKTHTQTQNIPLTNGFPLPNSKRLSLGRVPSRDKRSRGRRFHRNLFFILLGRDREGLLRLSIVHRLGVLPGTFLKMRSLCFFVSLRDERLSNVRERDDAKVCARLVSFVFSRKALRRSDDDFRRAFIRARCLKELDEWGKRSPSVLSRIRNFSHSLTLSLGD